MLDLLDPHLKPETPTTVPPPRRSAFQSSRAITIALMVIAAGIGVASVKMRLPASIFHWTNARLLYTRSVPATVTLYSGTWANVDSIRYSGSAFHIAPHVLLTAAHLAKRDHHLSITTSHTMGDGFVLYADTTVDVAIAYTPDSSSWLPLRADVPEAGEHVIVVGSPRGVEGTLSDGVVAQQTYLGNSSLVMFTNPITHGSSGSPLIDGDGQVAGMVTMSERDGYGFAVDVPTLQTVLRAFQNASPDSWRELRESAARHGLRGWEPMAIALSRQDSLSLGWIPTPAWKESAPWFLELMSGLVFAGSILTGGWTVLMWRREHLKSVRSRRVARDAQERIRQIAFLPEPLLEAECGRAETWWDRLIGLGELEPPRGAAPARPASVPPCSGTAAAADVAPGSSPAPA